MATLCISVGNPLRGDDGVAHRVLDLLGTAITASFLRVQQLTPEISEIIARARNVVIIDADVNATTPHVEPIARQSLSGSGLSHAMNPAEVVGLAAQLYGFTGAAFVCHVPGFVFGPGNPLSAGAETNALKAAQIIQDLCANFSIGQTALSAVKWS